MMRRRGPGLVGMAARTAVVAGTATAVSGRVARRQQDKYVEEQQAQAAAAPPPQEVVYEQAPAGNENEEMVEALKQIADLHAQGILSDEEFAAKKAQILGI